MIESPVQPELFENDANEGNLAIRRGDQWFALTPLVEEYQEESVIAIDETIASGEEAPRTTFEQFEGRPRIKDGRPRGIMIRLTPEQWNRIHALAIEENTSVQALGLCAFSRYFVAKGMSGL